MLETWYAKTLGILKHNYAEKALQEIQNGIDVVIYYVGFCDKAQQVSGSLNPVMTGHHNFTAVEPVGVVGVLLSRQFNFSKSMEDLCATLALGNTCVVLIPETQGALLAPLAEVLHTSDLPAGTVNLLSGLSRELAPHFYTHMEIQSLILPSDVESTDLKQAQIDGAENLKRIHVSSKRAQKSLESLLRTSEFKTVWHPQGH